MHVGLDPYTWVFYADKTTYHCFPCTGADCHQLWRHLFLGKDHELHFRRSIWNTHKNLYTDDSFVFDCLDSLLKLRELNKCV